MNHLVRHCLLISGLVCLGYIAAHAETQRIVTMKSPEKGTIRLYEGGRWGNKDEEISDIQLRGVSAAQGDRRLCGSSNRLERRLQQTRAQLELSTLVEKLKIAEKPRKLTLSETETLAQIPICDPFTFELRIISKLLQGYDFVGQKQALR